MSATDGLPSAADTALQRSELAKSATTCQLTKRQLLLPFAIGLVIGALAVQFWGTGWCPS